MLQDLQLTSLLQEKKLAVVKHDEMLNLLDENCGAELSSKSKSDQSLNFYLTHYCILSEGQEGSHQVCVYVYVCPSRCRWLHLT